MAGLRRLGSPENSLESVSKGDDPFMIASLRLQSLSQTLILIAPELSRETLR
jgi:hypothetical protein